MNSLFQQRSEEVLKTWTKNTKLSDILKIYQSRPFHNIDHLNSIFEYIYDENKFLIDIDSVILAILYHDIVYDVNKNDNEQRSIQLLRSDYDLDLDQTYLEHTIELIIATSKPFNNHQDLVIQTFVRADCNILYLEYSKLLDYEKKIRQEFSIFEDGVYYPARISFLNKAFQHTKNPDLLKLIDFLVKQSSKNV